MTNATVSAWVAFWILSDSDHHSTQTAQQCSMSNLDADFDKLQVGGGGHPDATAPPVLMPTHLRTSIKATDRDGGLISIQGANSSYSPDCAIYLYYRKPQVYRNQSIPRGTRDWMRIWTISIHRWCCVGWFFTDPFTKRFCHQYGRLSLPFLFADHIFFTRLSRVSNAQGEGLRAALERWHGSHYSNR